MTGCDGNLPDLPVVKTTYYVQYLIQNQCHEKIKLTSTDHFPTETYHGHNAYIDTLVTGLLITVKLNSVDDYNHYTTCLYLDSITGETYLSHKKLISNLINTSSWTPSILNGDMTITKRYVATLNDNDFQ